MMCQEIKLFDGRIVLPLLRCAGALACLLGSLVVLALMTRESGVSLIRFGGYYFTLAAATGVIAYFFRSACWRKLKMLSVFTWLSLIATVILGMWASMVHYEPEFKIAMDEYILASTAKSMHERGEVYTVSRISADGNRYIPAEGFVDKRPWAYATLLSLLHDVTGFRIQNSFLLNGALLCLLLAASYALGRQMFGPWGGVLSVLLWANLPLLGLSARGGGMELLGLTLLVCLVLFSGEYLKCPSRELEGLLSLCAVLLAYTRYECLLFILPVVFVILLGWYRAGRCFLSVGTLLASVLLVPLGLHLLAYMGNESAWELAEGAEAAFSLVHISENFGHALSFFFSYDHSLPNSLQLSVVGLFAVVALPLVIRYHWASIRASEAQYATLCYLPFVGLHMLLILGFHASRLDSPFVSRYALIFHLLLVVACLFLMRHFAVKWTKAWQWGTLGAFICLTAFTLPQNAKSTFVRRNFAMNEQRWLESLSEAKFASSALVIDRFTVPWSLRDWVSMPCHLAVQNSELLTNEVRMGKYPSIYFVERFAYAGDGAFRSLTYGSEQLHARFEMSLLAEMSFRPFTLTKVYSIQSYKGISNESSREDL